MEIKANNFRNLPNKEALQQRVAEKVATLAQANFSFLEWTAKPGVDRSLDQHLTILIDQQNGIPAPTIRLRFLAQRGKTEQALSENLHRIIYRRTDLERPTHNDVLLEQDLHKFFKTLFNSEEFKQELHRQFLTKIPLSTSISIPPGEKKVIVPLDWNILKSSGDSVFLVRFKASDGNTLQNGQMRLIGSRLRLGNPSAGATECRISFFDFSDIFLNSPDDWHTNIHKLFTPQTPTKVYMEKYIRDLFGWAEDGSFDRL